MMKKIVAALFMGLLLLSTFAATVNAFGWKPPEPDLPEDVVPYDVAMDYIYIENWWSEPAYYKGLFVIEFTAEVFVIYGMDQSILEITASSLAGNDMLTYSLFINIQFLQVTPEFLEDIGPEGRQQLHDLIGDPVTLPDVTLKMIAMEAEDTVTTDFACVPYPDEVTIKAKSLKLEDYELDEATYDGTAATNMTGDITVKDQVLSTVMNDLTYSLSGPKTVMENSVGYSTYVKGLGLGFLPLRWSGDNIPWLVKLFARFLPVMLLTRVTMDVISLTAETATMGTMKVDISA